VISFHFWKSSASTWWLAQPHFCNKNLNVSTTDCPCNDNFLLKWVFQLNIDTLNSNGSRRWSLWTNTTTLRETLSVCYTQPPFWPYQDFVIHQCCPLSPVELTKDPAEINFGRVVIISLEQMIPCCRYAMSGRSSRRQGCASRMERLPAASQACLP
jgi:hypothetical protein